MEGQGGVGVGEGFWFGGLDENVISLPLCQTERGNKSWSDYNMGFIFISLLSLGWGMGCCGSKQSVCGDAFMSLFRALEDAMASARFCGSFSCPGILRWLSQQLPVLFLGLMPLEHLEFIPKPSVLWSSVLWLRLDDLEAVVSAKPKMREKTPDVGPCHYIQASSPLSDLYTRSLTIPLMTSPAAQPGRSEVLDIKRALCL